MCFPQSLAHRKPSIIVIKLVCDGVESGCRQVEAGRPSRQLFCYLVRMEGALSQGSDNRDRKGDRLDMYPGGGVDTILGEQGSRRTLPTVSGPRGGTMYRDLGEPGSFSSHISSSLKEMIRLILESHTFPTFPPKSSHKCRLCWTSAEARGGSVSLKWAVVTVSH